MKWITDVFTLWLLGNIALTIIGLISEILVKRNIERKSCIWKVIVIAHYLWLFMSLYLSWKQLFEANILFKFAAFVWIGGLLGRFVDYAVFCARLVHIKINCIYDDELNNVLSTYMTKLRIKRNISVCRSAATKEGIVFGLVKPVVVIPTEMNMKLAEVAICHELMHIVNSDLVTVSLTQVIVLLGWMNPFALLLKEKIEKICELKCHLDVCKMDGKGFTNKEYLRVIA